MILAAHDLAFPPLSEHLHWQYLKDDFDHLIFSRHQIP
jgi:hypothetical protein